MTAVDALSCARRAFDWIESVAVEVDGGLGWREGAERFDDLYVGTAGVLLGCAEAAAGGLNVARIAEGARTRLVRLAAHDGPAAFAHDGLFEGWAGVAVALRAWSEIDGHVGAGEAATRVIGAIADRVLHAPPDSSACTDIISGHAGVLLALLDDRSGPAAEAATRLADQLVAMAEPGPDGLQWRTVAGRRHLLPGFSHGTAGVAYALAAAGRRLERPDLIAAATRGAEALLALGNHPDGWALPLSVPNQAHRPAVFFGWCHGPTGTVRLFLLLNEIDPQPRWQSAIDACLHAVATSGIPARLHPGFWDNLGRCCGTAGVGQLILDRYQATGDSRLLDWADALAADVIGHAQHLPAGVAWSNTEFTATPPALPPEPGFMQGAAGIAGWLARTHAVHAHRDDRGALTQVTPSWL